MELRMLVALIPLVVLPACSAWGDPNTLNAADPPAAVSSAASPAASESRAGPAMSRDEAEQLVRQLRAFAQKPTATSVEQVPFAPTVELGLGDTLVKTVTAGKLSDPAAWSVPTTKSYEWTGQPSLDVLGRLTGAEPYTTTIGPHPHCASPARKAPPAVADLAHVSTQPAQAESCLSWYSVDLFVKDGEIHAVTLDLWEP